MDWKVLIFVLSVVAFREDILDLEHVRPNQFSRVHWIDRKPRASRSANRQPRRVRREDSSASMTAPGNCKSKDFSAQMAEATSKKIFKGDSNPSIALAWTGDDGQTLLAVTTYESFVSFPSNIYRSTDGGRTFTNITSNIEGEYIRRRSGVLTATADSEKIVLIVNNHPLGFSESSTIYISSDKGEKWKRVEVPFELSGAQMKFHPTNSNMVLATDMNGGKLWISSDWCQTWKSVHDSGKTHAYKWDPIDQTGKVFYYTHDPTGTGRRQNFALTLYRSMDGGESVTKLAEHVWSFGTEDKFLYVSVRYQPEGDDKPTRIMHVSTDKGDKFSAVQLPPITSDQFYSILDANEDMIFMHVDDAGDTGKGTIFTSDETGIVFSVSLEKNLYPNGDDVTDFVRIESLNGVYITSQLKDDQSIESLITYDKGATWDQLQRPENCADGDAPCGCNKTSDAYCHLQVHCAFSMSKGVKVPEGPYSTETAPGLIFGHGNVGDALSTDDPDLYVSNNGGYSWNFSRKGPHKTLIGDSGSVIWAVKQEETIDTLYFSFDEGLCWYEHKFSPDKITITGLIAEPGETATDVAIWGWDDDSDSWVVYTFDFKHIMGQQCDEVADYEQWFAHEDIKLNNDQEKGCQLGQKHVYQKLKKDSICYQGKSYKPESNPQRCVCTKYDFMCDFGYKRNADTGLCERDELFEKRKADICIDGQEEMESRTYKLIPGDKCDPSKMDNKEKFEGSEKTIIKKKCLKQQEIPDDYGMEGSKTWLDYTDFTDLFEKHTDLLTDAEKAELDILDGHAAIPSGHGGLIALLVIGVICSVGAAGYFYRRMKTQSTVVQYQTFTDDDVPRLDVGTTTQYHDDAESDDDDMLA